MKCESKRHYASRAAAEAAATRTHVAKAKGSGWLYPYQCAQCGLWHLTSWTPAKQAAVATQIAAAARKQQPGITKVEPPSVKALRTKLTEVSVKIKLDEKRQDAARLKRAEAIGKLVEADLARAKAEQEYRDAQAAVLRLLGI